jgi:hypothetical protein
LQLWLSQPVVVAGVRKLLEPQVGQAVVVQILLLAARALRGKGIQGVQARHLLLVAVEGLMLLVLLVPELRAAQGVQALQVQLVALPLLMLAAEGVQETTLEARAGQAAAVRAGFLDLHQALRAQ